MSLFLVRLIKNHELVGIWNAEKIADLRELTNQCTDPIDCEYARLPIGGFMAPRNSAPIVPLIEDERYRHACFELVNGDDGGEKLTEFWKQFFAAIDTDEFLDTALCDGQTHNRGKITAALKWSCFEGSNQ